MAVLEVVCHAVVDNQNSGKRKESFSCIVHWSWKYTGIQVYKLLAKLLFSLSKLKKKKKKNKEEGREKERRERKRNFLDGRKGEIKWRGQELSRCWFPEEGLQLPPLLPSLSQAESLHVEVVVWGGTWWWSHKDAGIDLRKQRDTRSSSMSEEWCSWLWGAWKYSDRASPPKRIPGLDGGDGVRKGLTNGQQSSHRDECLTLNTSLSLEKGLRQPLAALAAPSWLRWISLSGWMWSEVKSLSCIRLFATQWTVAYQAPLFLGFSRQEYWNGLLFPSPGDRTGVSSIAGRRLTFWVNSILKFSSSHGKDEMMFLIQLSEQF